MVVSGDQNEQLAGLASRQRRQKRK